MATPPPEASFRKEDFPTTGLGTQDSLDKLFLPLNSTLASIKKALSNGLTLGQNSSCEVKSFTVTTPATDWQTLTLVNGFSNLGSGYETAQCRKDSTGRVTVKGLVVSASATPVTVTTLPAGYRPAENIRTATSGNAGAGDVFGSLTVLTTGDVLAQAGSATSNFSIDVSFYCSDFSPGVLSCWPQTVSTTITRPVAVLVTRVTDTARGVVPLAVGQPDWVPATGAITIRNLPGLLLATTYSVTVAILG